MGRPLAALTGATGFLGRHLVRALDQAGYRLRVLVSRPDAAFDDEPEGLERVVGRLEHSEALARLAADVDVLVHNAGLIKALGRDPFFRANAEGAEGAARALAAASPEGRFVLVSSISAREPHLSPYAASKAAGEAAVRAAIPEGRLTIVRPSAIYGPGDLETLAFFRAVARLPALPLPGSPDARLTMIHGADCAAQIAALAGCEPSGLVFTLSDDRPEGYPLKEIMLTAAGILGRRPSFLPAPDFAVMAAAHAGGLIGRVTGVPAFFGPGKAREMLHPDWSAPHAERPSGGPPIRFDLASGFLDSIAYWRALGRL